MVFREILMTWYYSGWYTGSVLQRITNKAFREGIEQGKNAGGKEEKMTQCPKSVITVLWQCGGIQCIWG